MDRFTLATLRTALLMEDVDAIKATILDVILAMENNARPAGVVRPAGDDIVSAITCRDEHGNLQLRLCRTDEGFTYVPVADGWARRVPIRGAGTGGGTGLKAGSPCPCRAAKGYAHGWCGVAGGGVPGCDH